MRWYHYVAYFFGGAFLANALPHLGNGISGHAFQSPFASPPGVGLSSSLVNVLWGTFNLAVGYLLVCRVGTFDLRKSQHILVFGAGFLLISLMSAYVFGRFHGGLSSIYRLISAQPLAFALITYASSHSNRRGFHPRIRFAFAFEAPLSFVA